jgi:hypothetical protein
MSRNADFLSRRATQRADEERQNMANFNEMRVTAA